MIDQRIPHAAARPWVGPESYWKPAVMVDSAWHEHAPFASWVTAVLRPRSVLELGTHNGFSFFVFCEAIERLGLEAVAVAVDSWVGDEHAGFYGEEIFEAVSAIQQSRYPTSAELRRGLFDEAAGTVEDGSVDLLHIDGRHGYEDITHDFETWLPKLSDRGVVLLHDTAERLPGFGVWRFWEEAERRFPSFEFRHGHGLGVLAVGGGAPQRLLNLMSSDPGTQESVRRVYGALGGDISREHEHRRAIDARLAELAERAAALGTEASELRNLVEGLHNQVEALHNQVEALRQEREHILASTSWRLTRPLRAVGAALHRGRGPHGWKRRSD